MMVDDPKRDDDLRDTDVGEAGGRASADVEEIVDTDADIETADTDIDVGTETEVDELDEE